MRITLLDGADARLEADFGAEIFFHVTFHQWGVRKFREYWEIFESVLAGLRRAGVTTVYAAPLEVDVKAQKMIRLFRFTERRRAGGLVLMERRL